MKVHGIVCKDCNYFIFSRAQHDFHWCMCESQAIDGGTQYTRLIGEPSRRYRAAMDVNATQTELYNDWALRHNQYGLHPVDHSIKSA